MSDDSFTYSYELDTLYGRPYQVGVRVDPDLNEVESFAVVLFYETGEGETVEIARIDDSKHEEGESDIHIDRLYREEGADRKDYEIPVDDVFEAEAYVTDNWERFARQYRQTHGE